LEDKGIFKKCENLLKWIFKKWKNNECVCVCVCVFYSVNLALFIGT